MQIIKAIFESISRESFKILVNFEFLKGTWLLFGSANALIHWPREDNDPLIDVSSWIYLSLFLKEYKFLRDHFSDPARSTILNLLLTICDLLDLDSFSRYISNIAWDLELLSFILDAFVALFLRPSS